MAVSRRARALNKARGRWGSARAASRRATHCCCPRAWASSRGASPQSSWMVGSAPAWTRSETIWWFPRYAATCRAVQYPFCYASRSWAQPPSSATGLRSQSPHPWPPKLAGSVHDCCAQSSRHQHRAAEPPKMTACQSTPRVLRTIRRRSAAPHPLPTPAAAPPPRLVLGRPPA